MVDDHGVDGQRLHGERGGRGCVVRVLGDKRDGAGKVEDQRGRRPREEIVTSTGARWQDEKVGTAPYQQNRTIVRGADADPVVGCAVFDS